ncbi:winged helix DNA-binding domain-containing protein [Vibrio sp. ZSDE26]|uniref:Winged helix DNA-binding domain-containing protein n=1 Tax=Vibrio amylolyticus TaxID=2847292 RepID=A0A9X1XK56_9VIBR|nr:crosslink repair DNA glycosylase YcaQ family protein [Vibrio amylolyticus]MCK6264422.1 winged helix DNA-binding domain-containing protein [Vibrio amylolyticus]
MESLSIPQARKLALLSQGLPEKSSKTKSDSTTLRVFERLGYVQIDTISVVQRAHHHTLWSRNPNYQTKHLDQLVSSKRVFEYWAHAAAYLPMPEYRFSLPRKMAFKTGEQTHWYRHDKELMSNVLKRIEQEGPLMAKDFVSENRKSQGWGSKPTKQALECLFMQGDLMISERRNFHKVYDLTERVLPSDIDISLPSDYEHGRFRVMRYLKSHGFGNLSEMSYLLKGMKTQATQALNELVEEDEVTKVTIANSPYYVSREALSLLDKRVNRKRAKILSPFDNLLIQRKRAKSIFDYDYLLECYVPEKKRQYGYFCLPILWGGELVGRADCKVDKKLGVLNVIHLFVDVASKSTDAFWDDLDVELSRFTRFNGCESHVIHKVSVE